MKRRIIEIDREKCNGCGICADACHEGAIGMKDGKAVLLRDDYCDGLGDCLPTCPTGAISFIEKDTLPYDEAAVKANMEKKKAASGSAPSAPYTEFHGCPGSRAMKIEHRHTAAPASAGISDAVCMESQLCNWPVQIKLAPIKAPYFDGANLLVAADCTAYAYANFHRDFIKGRVALIGCPKLDMIDYTEKLEAIIAENDIKSLTILRMEVPCCGGIEMAAKSALQNSGKFIPWNVVTISTEGEIL